MSEDKYDWLPTESAKKDFPMQIIKGDLIFRNDNSIYIPDHRLIENGWGQIGSIHVVGEDLKPLPETLIIAWFSYIESNFFLGEFELPFDKIEKLFKKGFNSPVDGKQTTYKYIIVGLGLKGAVSIWLSGDGIVKEVAQFDAEEADEEVDWRHITLSDLEREQYIEKTLLQSFNGDEKKIEKAKKHAAQENPWEGYRIKYDWNIDIAGTAKPLSIWSSTFNGEKEYINYEKGKSCEQAERSVPKSMILNWASPEGKKYSTDITFNTGEIFKAFDKLYSSNPDDTLQLQIEIDASSYSLETYLINSKYTLALQKTKTEVFSHV